MTSNGPADDLARIPSDFLRYSQKTDIALRADAGVYRLQGYKTDAGLDGDEDGLTNLAEQNAGTVPRDSDTDNDGYLDGDDTDPLDRMNPISMEALPSRGGWRAILR